MIRCAGAAWGRFCRDKREVIIRGFRCIDVSLTTDGPSDGEISNKGLPAPHLVPTPKNWKTRGAPTADEGTTSTSGDASGVSSSDDEIDDQGLPSASDAIEVNQGYATCPPIGGRAVRAGEGAMARTYPRTSHHRSHR